MHLGGVLYRFQMHQRRYLGAGLTDVVALRLSCGCERLRNAVIRHNMPRNEITDIKTTSTYADYSDYM